VSIKRRLYLTYFAGLMVTIILMGTVAFITHGSRIVPPWALNQDEEQESENMMSYAFQFYRLNSVEEASRTINRAIVQFDSDVIEPGFGETWFWQAAEQKMKENVSLVVFRNSEVLYLSDRLPAGLDTNQLPQYGEVKPYPNEYYFKNFEQTVQRQIDYKTNDGDQISIFIFLGVGSETSRVFLLILNNLLAFMVVSTIVMGLISFFVVRSITIPLAKLKVAVDEVRRGNLEHEVKHTTKDKIGELSDAFEAMRLQLVENETLRDQYESNRRQMISSISHDLRTPVTSIKLHAEGIMDGVAGSPEKMSKYLKSMSSNAQVIDRLLKELTLFSNLDAEQETFQFSYIDISRFIQDLVGEWEYDYQKDDVKFSVLIEESEASCLKMDVIHFRRVMVNLVENALKYVENRPLEITIQIEWRNGYCRLSLKDNGEGVAHDQLEQIFDRFHRVDEARQTSVSGSGLGLSIARQIVLKHNGRIWANNHENGGLEVCIDLPITEEVNNGTYPNC